jgi:hypothetical protein
LGTSASERFTHDKHFQNHFDHLRNLLPSKAFQRPEGVFQVMPIAVTWPAWISGWHWSPEDVLLRSKRAVSALFLQDSHFNALQDSLFELL